MISFGLDTISGANCNFLTCIMYIELKVKRNYCLFILYINFFMVIFLSVYTWPEVENSEHVLPKNMTITLYFLAYHFILMCFK